VEPSRLDQAHDHRAATTRTIGSGKEPVRTAERNRTDPVLEPVVIDRHIAIIQVARQRFPTTQAVSDGLLGGRARRDLREFPRQPRMELRRDRSHRLWRLAKLQVPRKRPRRRVATNRPRPLAPEQAQQVWAADMTYIPMAHGFQYLVAIIDLYSRKVMAWRVSNTMTADFCVEALQDALARHGTPEIFNTDQGSQFTSDDWISELKAAGVKISMDGKGRWIDNVFIERLWRSVKYEDVYLKAYETGGELRCGISAYFAFYNTERTHQALDYGRPDDVYYGRPTVRMAA